MPRDQIEGGKEEGVKGNATYFDLSKQNDSVAWWVGRNSMLDTCVTCPLDNHVEMWSTNPEFRERSL